MFRKEEDKKAYVKGDKAGFAEGMRKEKHYVQDSKHAKMVHDQMKHHKKSAGRSEC